MSMFTNATNKFWCLVMTGLADVDGFIICIQACMWLGFPPLNYSVELFDNKVRVCVPLVSVLALSGKTSPFIRCVREIPEQAKALFSDIFVWYGNWIFPLHVHNWRESSKVMSLGVLFSWTPEPENRLTNGHWKLTKQITESWWFFACSTFYAVNQFTLQWGFDSIGHSRIIAKEILNTR